MYGIVPSIMDIFFQNLFSADPLNSFQRQYEQAQAFAHQHTATATTTGPPPACPKATRQLPLVQITSDDILYYDNHDCCICLEDHTIGTKVIRMPCAHMFHSDCIHDWLSRHCTCPVCRYELPTLDEAYERGRKERMKHIKPRIPFHQLEKMSKGELQNLCRQCSISISTGNATITKELLMEILIESEKIDIIALPKPVVEYSLEELRAMSISKLKSCMRHAGVFFDVKEVLEKEDMVRIFCNSGRILLKQGQWEEGYGLDGYQVDIKPAAVETTSRLSDHQLHGNSGSTQSRGELIVETVASETEQLRQPGCYSESAFPMFGSISENMVGTEQFAPSSTEAASETEIPWNDEALEESNGELATNTVEVTNEHLQEASLRHSEQVPTQDHMDLGESRLELQHAVFINKSISDLKCLARRANIDLSHCIERSEMIDTLVAVGASPVIQPTDFAQWSVSGLRALATEVHVDLSYCTCRHNMVEKLVQAAFQRPHVANYLNALMPLASLTISQLRALAREWQLNVSDCLEKEEMIHRLVVAGGPNRGSDTR